MKKVFFPRLAWNGIKSNRRLYLPYILTCTGMVTMYYIITSLVYSPLLQEMRGGGNMSAVLSLGRGVIAVFALIFLFYTNSFLIRRRKKEFGLYNILGMNKLSIARILFFESVTMFSCRSNVCRNQMTTVATKITVNALCRKSLDFSHRSCATFFSPGIR